MPFEIAKRSTFAALSVAALLPLAGFVAVSEIFQQDYWYALFLTMTATVCWCTALFWWRPSASRYPHVYLFFALYMLGYFLKFYVLAHFVQNDETYWEYVDVYYRFERQVLEDHESVIKYYEIATIGLLFATFGLGILKVLDVRNFTKPRQLSLGVFNRIRFSNQLLRSGLGFTVCLFVVLLAIQAWFGLNLVSGDERQLVVLPYHLGGIILAT